MKPTITINEQTTVGTLTSILVEDSHSADEIRHSMEVLSEAGLLNAEHARVCRERIRAHRANVREALAELNRRAIVVDLTEYPMVRDLVAAA